ncbi:MAG: hypothetical protein AB1512_20890 [Thermodesulfobacteriota bacterium]
MKEITLRKWHRTAGIVLAVFIAFQALTGLALSLAPLASHSNHSHGISDKAGSSGDEEELWEELMEFVHHGAGPVGAVYRIALALGTLWMAVTGFAIYLRIKERTRAA